MEGKINLSIIVVNWNTSKVTARCIETIIKFIKNIKYEIIIIDNASSDNSVYKFKELQKKLKESKIKIIENSLNLGFAKACNQGAEISSGKFLFFLNSDIELIDNSFKKMFEFFQKDESVGAIGPQFLNPDFTPQASVFPKQSVLNAFKEFWFNIPSYSKYLPSLEKPSYVWSISGGAILIRKKFFEKIGKWNEKYFFYFEDMDLCRTIHKFNKTIFYYPECKIIHYHGLSGKKLESSENQWKRLIPGSIKFHGFLKHYLIFLIIWSSQKWKKIISLFL